MSRSLDKYAAMMRVEDRGSAGEVTTSADRAIAEINKIPEAYFTSKTTTFLDPCFGNGTFIIELIKKLKSYGHSIDNIETRVFGCEISKRLFNKVKKRLAKYNFDGIINGDTLTVDWNNMKFDVVLTNFPFQKNTNSNKGNQQGGYWYEFLNFVLTKFEPEVGAFINPTSMFSTGGFGTKNHKVSAIINKGYGFTDITNVTSDFNVGINISAYVLVKGHVGMTKTDAGKLQMSLDYPAPYILSDINSSIIGKTYYYGGGWTFKEVFVGKEDDFQVRTNGGRFKIWDKTTVGKGNFGNKGQGIVINEDEVSAYESLFKSKLFKYIYIILGGESGQSATGILKALPNPGVRIWKAEELYDLFNLTDEEIAAVEAID